MRAAVAWFLAACVSVGDGFLGSPVRAPSVALNGFPPRRGNDAPLSRVLFAGNLDLGVADLEAAVRAVFGAYGNVASVDMGRNKKENLPAPFAMVAFRSGADAAAAAAALDGAASRISAGNLRVEASHQTASASRARERNAERGTCDLSDGQIAKALADRADQRANGNFNKADAIRDKLGREGVIVDDAKREWRTGDGRSGSTRPERGTDAGGASMPTPRARTPRPARPSDRATAGLAGERRRADAKSTPTRDPAQRR
ncbi:hypothetical protein M885DRAFT_579007 [Pelagophyceae sp. CCMP2097]|nr:hypothetical protein M885DRAFT_579007 [Pelagophyceae sp. CCMP2097]